MLVIAGGVFLGILAILALPLIIRLILLVFVLIVETIVDSMIKTDKQIIQ